MTPSRRAREQDDRWQSFVDRVRSGPPRPFAEHWAAWQKIFANRRPAAAPPSAGRPAADRIAASNLGRLMAERQCRDYANLHRWSATERPEFWAMVIDRLGIVFGRRPDQILDRSGDVANPRWLPGARLSIVDSCFRADARAPAVISGAEGSAALRVTTRGALEALVNRVANGLRARQFAPGDGIALYMPMTVECVAAYLGAVRAGCRVVSIADSFPAGELARRCRLGDAAGVVTVESYARSGRAVDLYSKVREAKAPRTIVIPSDRDRPTGAARLRDGDLWWSELLPADAFFRPEPDDPYAVTNVLFSSGTTGEPKAIPWTHLTPIKCAMDGHFHQDIRAGDVVAWPTNIGWMMGPWLIYASLINGAAMALYEGAPAGRGFARFVRDSGVSMLGAVPSMVRAWRGAGDVGPGEWERIRVFSSTGEPSSREDALWLMSLTGYRAPIIEYLGGTEIGGGHITGTVVQPASPATFTTPALGIDFVILDDEGRPVGEGDAGDLFLIPPSIGLSQRLLNDDHQRVYYEGCPRGPRGAPLRRHGDRFTRLPGGFFRALGRSDDTMNLGGIKVSALELEQVMDRHPAVYESAAVAVQPGGEGAERLVVFVVPKPGVASPVDRKTLMAGLKRLLAARLNPLFKIHDLVVVEALPRTASNKLMRRELRARYQGDAPAARPSGRASARRVKRPPTRRGARPPARRARQPAARGARRPPGRRRSGRGK
jgi:acetyl-CoA synthetase